MRLAPREMALLPVIFLTVRGDSHDVVGGFQKGADDYVVKPFELGGAALAYPCFAAPYRQVKVNCYHCDSLTLDMDKMSVFCDDEELVFKPAGIPGVIGFIAE